MNITLKKATESDWQEIAEIEKSVEAKTFHAFTKQDELEEYLQTSEVFFVCLKDDVAGEISYKTKGEGAEINNVAILPQYQGQGIGRAALGLILDKIGPDKRVELFTHPENTPAIIRYLKAGFQIKGWVDDKYGDGEPRLHLTKD